MTDRPRSDYKTLVVHLRAGEAPEGVYPRPLVGVRFSTTDRQAAEAPDALALSTGYVESQPWIEVVNPSAVVAPAGPKDAPMAKTHLFPQAEALIFHMTDGDYRYRVVRQPGKYNADGTVATTGGDPTAEVFWDYLVELED